MKKIKKWRQYELILRGPSNGNPYTEVELSAIFRQNEHQVKVRGFYSDEGVYKVRYMPSSEGRWEVKTISNVPELNNQTDVFECVGPEEGNHGPVIVSGKTHFSYADGSGYIPFGTTAYEWALQPKEVRKQTLKSLKLTRFNKIRMSIFPKSAKFNTLEPEMYPFEGKPTVITDGLFDYSEWYPKKIGFDFTRFNSVYFDQFEKSIQALDQLGIEADIILFQPYDHWGFARMGKENNIRYLQYVIARFASYKNVWWSMANEYDLMDKVGQIDLKSWDSIGQTIQDEDPSGHLTSVHNWYDPPVHKGNRTNWYDYSKPWITHLGVQTDEVFFVPQWISEYQKPVIVDEMRYEGNIDYGWGDMTGQQMFDLFARTILRGGGATHGEVYIDKPDTLRPIWWAHGGKLYGESYKRINYLKDLMDSEGFKYVIPQAITGPHWELAAGARPDKKKILIYFGQNHSEFEWLDFLPDKKKYSAELIDAWNMTQKHFSDVVTNDTYTHLPMKEYQMLLLTEKN
ncbi:DUF5060 domain-containing protein [Pediococcus siamensis]|uniref:DUF5060 domain-containing protein n=1 Tax=Pediococcus siamensis TaxID=381829 RepID=UPI0039A2A92D